MKMVFTPHAMKDSDDRLFPASKNRSARIRKKLIKRYGGEFVRVPAMYQVGDTIIAHPSFQARIEAATRQSTRNTCERMWLNNYFGRAS